MRGRHCEGSSKLTGQERDGESGTWAGAVETYPPVRNLGVTEVAGGLLDAIEQPVVSLGMAVG